MKDRTFGQTQITILNGDIQKLQDSMEELLNSYTTFNTVVGSHGQSLNTIGDNISTAIENTETASEDFEEVAGDVEDSRELVRDYVIIAAVGSIGLAALGTVPYLLGIKGIAIGGGSILGAIGAYKIFF